MNPEALALPFVAAVLIGLALLALALGLRRR